MTIATIRTVILIVIAGLALLLFGGGVAAAGYYTLGPKGPAAMPSVISYYVSGVNGALAANLGAVLGISFTVRQHGIGPVPALQWIAAGWYVLMLVVAGVLWYAVDFTEEEAEVVALLPELAKNGIGIMIAVLAAVLGVQAMRSAGPTAASE